MRLTNPSATRAIALHDEVRGEVEQYQGGIKSVNVPVSSSVDVPNINVGDSEDVANALQTGKLLAGSGNDPVEDVNVTYDTGGTPTVAATPTPKTPGVIAGLGKIIYAGFHTFAGAGTYIIQLTPLSTVATAPDLAILGHIDPNNEVTTDPVGVILTAGAAAVTAAVAWTEASGPAAGDADCAVTITASGAGQAGIIILG